MQHLDCDCTYNDGVLCGIKNPERCEKCGWNPKVWERRKGALFGEKSESNEETDCRGASPLAMTGIEEGGKTT